MKRTELKKFLRDLPGIISGTKPSRFGLHKTFWGAVAHSLFTSIYAGFKAKSEGGTDELGESWEDIQQHTKAYHRDVAQGGTDKGLVRRRRYNMGRLESGERRGLGLLTPGQYKLWKNTFGVIYHHYKDNHGTFDQLRALKSTAAQIAWTRVKESGGVTMWDVLGTRKLPLLVRTGELEKALTPGTYDPATGYKKGNKNQVYVVNRGAITIGVNLAKANYVSKQRPLWPADIDLWLNRAVEAGVEAVFKRLQEILED